MLIDRVISLTTAAGVEPVVVQQHDRESRTVRFFVYESSGVPLDVQGKTARIFFRKNGATSIAYEADVAADGWISLTVPDAVTAIPGNGEMQLALVYGSSILHSFTIPFAVKGSLSFVGETESPEDDPMRIAWDTLPGKPSTFPPSAHTHTPAQAGALPANGTAANAAKLNNQWPGYYRSAQNIVHNSNFPKAINQRGVTTTTEWEYCLDRWIARSGGIELTVEKEGLRLASPNPSNVFLYQKLEIPAVEMLGKTYTVAICDSGGNIACQSVTLPANEPTAWTTYAVATAGNVFANLIHTATGDHGFCVSVGRSGSTADGVVRWVALYEGSYTAETLPDYVPLPPAVEWMICRRYYKPTVYIVATKTQGNFYACSAPHGMRGTPTVTPIEFAPYGATSIKDMTGCRVNASENSILYAQLPTCAAHSVGGLAVSIDANL